ncbi:MAG: agmatinase [Elusimicrobia bacterium]|nr:agmatinase [Elusimicrobiota bacterium]
MEYNASRNFNGLPEKHSLYSTSRIAILPVPFDGTSTWIKGADKGPSAIIEASQNLELYDIETGSEVFRKGIYTGKEIKASGPDEMVGAVYKEVGKLLEDEKFPVIIGGEHSVSIGAVRAVNEFHGGISVLHLDAHSDMRDIYEGSPNNHACVMARVKEMGCRYVSVGIRSSDTSELKNIERDRTFYAENIYGSGDWMEKVIDSLPEGRVYITIDLDVFDIGLMPSTGTPEPGGLDWYQVTGLLRRVAENREIVAFDVVELCPSGNKAPDFLAAKLIYKLLSYIFRI